MKNGKKILSVALATALCVCAFTANGSKTDDVVYSVGGAVMKSEQGFAVTDTAWNYQKRFDLRTGLAPVWEAKTVYNETVAFVGEESEAKLLHAPMKVISVTDYYLRVEYEENVDYVIEGNTIKLTPETNICYWETDFLYSDTLISNIDLRTEAGKYIYYSETEANRHQICVTYEHAETWKGAVPVGQSEKLPKTLAKLKNGEAVEIGVIGDSITNGSGASLFTKSDPSQGWYAKLVGEYLAAKFPEVEISVDNQAVGGTGSTWGQNNISRLTAPDLAIVAFGMNDATKSAADYNASIAAIVGSLKAQNADMEIILVSSMLPNPEAVGKTGNIPAFEAELVKIAEANAGVAIAPMTAMSTSLYEDFGKRFIDVNSNNINHPNDFLHRVYAQTVLKTLLGEEFTIL